MVQRSAELRHLPPSPAPPGPSKGSPALPKLLSHLKYPQIIHQELAVPERDLPQNEPTFRAIYSAAIIHTHTHIYIYLFCFMEGVTQEGNAQAGHRQGCGVRCAMYECVCGAGVCMQCVCKMGEHLHKARGASCRAPVRQEHACIVWVLVQAVPACKRRTAMCMQGVSADLKCTHKAQTCAKGKRLFAGGKMLVPKLPCPPSCCVTCCPCSALLLTSHSFCRIVVQCMGPQASRSSWGSNALQDLRRSGAQWGARKEHPGHGKEPSQQGGWGGYLYFDDNFPCLWLSGSCLAAPPLRSCSKELTPQLFSEENMRLPSYVFPFPVFVFASKSSHHPVW